MPTELLNQILTSSSLPSMPAVAIRVLELTQAEDASVDAIAEVIQQDPALTAKLLQTANSPLFGLAKKVASIQHATVLLGLRTVKIMALSFSLVDSLEEAGDTAFDYKKYWRRSLTMAVVARRLADLAGQVRADECFVGGLLADIGMLAIHKCVPEEYVPILRRAGEETRPVQEIEAHVLGITHARVAAEMLRKWSLPDMLCDATAAHHGEGLGDLGERTRLLASVLFASALVADLFCGDVPAECHEEVRDRCLELVPVSAEALEKLLSAIHTDVEEMASLFRLEIGETILYDMLRSQAMSQLAQISLSAEMDRVQATTRAEQAQQKIELLSRKASTDGLTQIANRQAFDEELDRTVAAAQAARTAMGLILLDIDHFKRLNDTHGHQAGDEALRRVGQCLKSICTDTITAARYGGEEFAVILADATARSLQRMAETIRNRIEKIEFEYDSRPIQFTASLGVAHIDTQHEVITPKEIVERADECLYDAKQGGRNRVEMAF